MHVLLSAFRILLSAFRILPLPRPHFTSRVISDHARFSSPIPSKLSRGLAGRVIAVLESGIKTFEGIERSDFKNPKKLDSNRLFAIHGCD